MEHLYHPLQGLGNILEQRVQRVQELEGGGGVVRHRCCTYFYTLVFGDSLCIPGCPRTRYVDLDGLELTEIPQPLKSHHAPPRPCTAPEQWERERQGVQW